MNLYLVVSNFRNTEKEDVYFSLLGYKLSTNSFKGLFFWQINGLVHSMSFGSKRIVRLAKVCPPRHNSEALSLSVDA